MWDTGGATQLKGTINVNGVLKLKSEMEGSYAGVVNGNVNLKSGGKILVEKGSNNTFLAISSGALTAEKNSAITTSSIVFGIGSAYDNLKTIHLGDGDVYKDSFTVVRTTNNVVELENGESYLFSSVKFHDVANRVAGAYNELTFDLNGAQLEITKVVALGVVPSLGKIILKDFAAGLVKVDNFTSEMISTGEFTIDYVTVQLEAYDKNNKLLSGLWSIDDRGYLFNSGLVPEPAEWASIFGAIALAFAAYRRRK